MTKTQFTGIDQTELARVLADGMDHGGNPVVSYADPDGGRPVRCCLGFSELGDEIALIAWSPFSWQGPYRETGPIFVHVGECSGPESDELLPADLDGRPMVLRPYTRDHRIAYHHVRHVPEGESVSAHVAALLEEPDVDMVHGRNVTGGCYSFQARVAVSGSCG